MNDKELIIFIKDLMKTRPRIFKQVKDELYAEKELNKIKILPRITEIIIEDLRLFSVFEIQEIRSTFINPSFDACLCNDNGIFMLVVWQPTTEIVNQHQEFMNMEEGFEDKTTVLQEALNHIYSYSINIRTEQTLEFDPDLFRVTSPYERILYKRGDE